MPPDGDIMLARSGPRADVEGRTASASSSSKLPEYTWQEVAKHNTADSAWVIVEGLVYDVTNFLDKHPGGREMLLVAAGRECTDLFTSYHWWDGGDKARKYLAAYVIGRAAGVPEFPVYPPDTRGFYKTLSQRVRAHFERTGTDPKDPVPGLWRLAVIFAVAGLSYALVHGLLLPGLPFAARVGAAIVFGIFQAMPLLHAMHDASHTAIGRHEGWWKAVGRLTLDWFAGGSMITWHHQHIVGHHVYTNVFWADPDVPYAESGDPRFLNPQQKWAWAYKYQWLYLPVLYGLLGFTTRVNDVVATYVDRTSGPVRVNFYNPAWLRVYATKGFWALWRIAIPLLVLRVPLSTFLPLFAVGELATGYWLAWNFEVSHVAGTVQWPQPRDAADVRKEQAAAAGSSGSGKAAGGKGGKAEGGPAKSNPYEAAIAQAAAKAAPGSKVLPLPWAVSQAATSVDYGHSPLTTWWTGALNYQIEHHLFPGISQYAYPAIAGIVRDTCAEFGVPYRYEPTFWAAWKAHVQYLYDLGQAGKAYVWGDN